MVSSGSPPLRGATLRAHLTLALLLAPGTAGADEAVEAAVALFRADRPAEASQQLHALADDPLLGAADRSRARYYLARSLHTLGMVQSAQLELVAVMEQGPSAPYFNYALSGLLDMARQTGDPALLIRVVDQVEPAEQPPRAQPSIRYLQGLGAWQRGEAARANALLGAVPPDSDLYPRARYLQGLILAEGGKHKAAVSAFRDVVEAAPESGDRQERELHAELRALATLRIARVYDRLGDHEQAERFYGQVERDSRAWAEALEAMARIDLAQGEPASALKRSAAASWPVVPASSPRSTAVPRDAELLHAQALHALCRPGEARGVLRWTEERALPLWSELAQATAAHRDASGAWQDTARAWTHWIEAPPQDSTLGAEVFEVLLDRGDLAETLRRQRRIEAELTLLDAQDQAWRDEVGEPLRLQLEAERAHSQAEAGRALLDAMAAVEADLGALLTRSEAQRGALDEGVGCPDSVASPLTGDPDAWGSEQRDPDPTEMSWPYTGEIWADEL